MGVVAFIHSSSSIAVNWSAPVRAPEVYVILYSTEWGTNMTQLVEGGGQTSSVLTSQTEGQLYTIKMLSSLLSDPVHLYTVR